MFEYILQFGLYVFYTIVSMVMIILLIPIISDTNLRYKMLKNIMFYTTLYFILSELYNNLILIQSMYEKTLDYYSDKYKHTAYIYDCKYANCFPYETYLRCKCLLE